MKCTVPPLDQAAAVGADPEAAVVGGKQAKYAVLTKGRRILMGKQTKARTIEPQQTTARSHPKITVRRLGEGLHGFLR